MPQSSYLASGEYTSYGLSASTTAAQVAVASGIIDAYLMRPEGLVWSPDAAGAPGWMASLDPKFTLTLAADVAPGANVTVTVTSAGFANSIKPGEVLILDRSNANAAEAVVVTSVTGASMVLEQISFAHSAGAKLDAGMVIVEERVLPHGRPKGRVAHWPVARLFSGVGRYGYGRRSQGSSGMPVDEYNLMATMSAFGGPPLWELMTISAVGIEPEGDFWIPAGRLLAYYTRVKLWHVCGWPVGSVPTAIKLACANIINTNGAMTGIPAGLKTAKAGDTSLTRFAASQMDDDTRAMLERYKVRQFA